MLARELHAPARRGARAAPCSPARSGSCRRSRRRRRSSRRRARAPSGRSPCSPHVHRDVVVAGLEAPRAGEPAAAGVERLDLDAHLLQQLDLGVDAAGRLVVAVAPDEGLALEPRRLDVELLEELGEVVRALREPLRVVVVRQELPELVLEDGHAARLEPDDRDALAVPLAQLVEAAAEVALGQVEEAVVVQRPPAADVALGDRRPASRPPRAPRPRRRRRPCACGC